MKIKKKYISTVLLVLCANYLRANPSASITHEADGLLTLQLHNQQEKMQLFIGLINASDWLKNIGQKLDGYLSSHQQKLVGFRIKTDYLKQLSSVQEIKKIYDQGYSLVVFLNEISDKKGIELRIYDAQQAIMLKGKRKLMQAHEQTFIEEVADELWHELTGQEGIFTTKVAYCKEYMIGKKSYSDLYMTSPGCYNPQSVVKGGKLLAPRWNMDMNKPLLFYSELTVSNIRLMSVTMDKARKIVSNFNGLNMIPSLSHDGNKVVYCSSKEGSSQLYCYEFDDQHKKATLKKLTHNEGNNISPTLRENGDIIFCSDFETKNPQIYYYHADTKIVERITTGGYCTAPTFCEKSNKIAYSKLIGDIMQIFVYDLTTKKDEQLTFDGGSKDESTWSPQGNYIAYAVDFGKASRIALMNLYTKEQCFLTPEQERCTYPAWSPGKVVIRA